MIIPAPETRTIRLVVELEVCGCVLVPHTTALKEHGCVVVVVGVVGVVGVGDDNQLVQKQPMNS